MLKIGRYKSRCAALFNNFNPNPPYFFFKKKSKYTESKHEQNIAMVQMQREIDILRATEDSFRKKVLELELDNDDLERTER